MTTTADVRAVLRLQGLTAAEWARSQGFPPALVYRVLRGEARCQRGTTHRIARALGLLEEPTKLQQELLHRILAPSVSWEAPPNQVRAIEELDQIS